MPQLIATPDQALAAAWNLAVAGPFLAHGPVADLAQALYQGWWCPGTRPVPPDTVPEADRPDDLSCALSETARRAAPSEEWWVTGAEGPVLHLGRTGPDGARRTRTATDGDVLDSSRPGLPVRPGDRVRVAPGSAASTGYWWWWSTGPTAPPALGTERVYLDLSFEGALGAVPVLIPWLAAGEPTRPRSFKCPRSVGGYGRRDSLVVYLADDDPLLDDLDPVLERLSALTRGDGLPLTAHPYPGISRAQDSGTDRSFGEIRCHAVATAVRQALGEGAAPGGEAPVETLRRLLVAAGIDLAVPDRCGLWEGADLPPRTSHPGPGGQP